MPDDIARCVWTTLQRIDKLWIMVCLTCPTRRGHNARGRTYADDKTARMAGRDHARGKVRHRVRVTRRRAEHADWIERVLASESWDEFVTIGRERYPFNWGVVTPNLTDARAHMAYTKTQLTHALEILNRKVI